ncbi:MULTISPECIES: hypothetical protein [unclassified Pseudonocardia]|jgi:hypothetical protein|uniref:hypothetical protein n=1 Tax=unclassified Pseudonocardia TaxID=2619320 RepID=UPI0009666E1E|nr:MULTISPECIES: hypothetical protein [unclassified Pseudonocardia]MBN9098626.1 hypothetical protein [Pseudonocardia sp.]OJY52045.1 MAG: hypothetical protein BGP03_08370 [Pseudonocardia sp. 73-21]
MAPHLTQLPDLLRAVDPPVDERVLALVDAEYGRWRSLHDRLVALIVELLDVASDGRSVTEVITRLIDDTAVGIDDLVGSGTDVDAGEIAALLRAHGSRGTVEVDGPVTTFRHACGSGGHYWREHPDVTTVADGEVPGVPGGRPRYCARCVRSIAAHAGDAWRVTPPERPEDPCTWTVTTAR